MGSIDKMIKWFKDREGKVTYSQSNRLGPNSYDCSSAVYFALAAGGFIPSGSMGWTGSLHDSTLPPIAKKITRSECKKGDIFVSKYWANDGHTGVFVDNSNIIHCSYGRNGIYTTPANGYMGYEPIEYYRLTDVSGEVIENEGGETNMQCIYWRPRAGKPTQEDAYYFDGTNSKYLSNGHQISVLKMLYKDINGKDMIEYHFSGNVPWYTRLEEISAAKLVDKTLG